MRIGVWIVIVLMLFAAATPVLSQVTDSAQAEIRSVMAQGRKASLEGDSEK